MSLLTKIPTVLGAGGGGGSILPPELQGCEYLQTDGNCYINTKSKILDINYIDVEVYLPTNGNILGGGQSGRCIVRLSNSESTNNKYFALCWQNANYNKVSTVEYGNWVNVIFDKQNKKIIFNDEILSITGSYSTDTTDTLHLFCLHYTNISPFYFYAPNGSKIKRIETNLFNLVACYIKADCTYTDNKGTECPAGTPGMFDTVNSIFYTNDGIGSFTAGPDINI